VNCEKRDLRNHLSAWGFIAINTSIVSKQVDSSCLRIQGLSRILHSRIRMAHSREGLHPDRHRSLHAAKSTGPRLSAMTIDHRKRPPLKRLQRQAVEVDFDGGTLTCDGELL
jgi:hypothetical protein